MLFQNSLRVLKQVGSKGALFGQIRASSQLQSQINFDSISGNKEPSVLWSADILHGLSAEQVEFRANIRSFFEKELPPELCQKVSLNFVIFPNF